MKVTSNDLINILKRFGAAGSDAKPGKIEHIKIKNPKNYNLVVEFLYERRQFFVLFDDQIDDNASDIEAMIKLVAPNIEGEPVNNPTEEDGNFGLPFKGKDCYLFQTVSTKKRLDVLLASTYPENSRSTWQKLIKAGHVSVNGKEVLSAKTEVSPTDKLQITQPEIVDNSAETLPIIYLDDHVIVIDKPAGVLTHSKGALNDEFTVADFFRRYTSVGLETNRPGIVHRLDRDTSGVMIGARTAEAYDLLKSQFADRRAKKTYFAISDGIPKIPEAVIDLPIGRNPSSPSTFRVDASGKSATTNYKILAQNDHAAKLELKPRTGRTHQLRVHLAYIGAPIHGDRVYGKPSERLMLHASELELTIPKSDRQVFKSPTPPEFDRALDDKK